MQVLSCASQLKKQAETLRVLFAAAANLSKSKLVTLVSVEFSATVFDHKKVSGLSPT